MIIELIKKLLFGSSKEKNWVDKQDEDFLKFVGKKALENGLSAFIVEVDPETPLHCEAIKEAALSKESIKENPRHYETFQRIKNYFEEEFELEVSERGE